jgi:hypothetical protein
MNDTIKLEGEMPKEEVTDDVIGPESKSLSQSVEKIKVEAQEKEKVEIEEVEESDDKNDDTAEKLPSTDDVDLKGTALLKSLLSTSTASIVPVVEKMITTTEVTDETLNLKKILYQPDEEEDEQKEPEESVHQVNTNEAPADEDDRRLIIDISDEEKDGTGERKHIDTPVPLLISREEENKVLRRMTRPSTLETGPPQMRPITRHHMRSQSE